MANKASKQTLGINFSLIFQRLRENSMFMLDSEVEEFFKNKLKITEHMVTATFSNKFCYNIVMISIQVVNPP